ncbi:hypothetical protein CLV49_0352 [Labedella gwakjiensis]|uniref:LPXTG-motif cell wall-anchored protein n=1 Tax=Labedella gwakjiensis TaxID=390269 RepID=A0A2P8GS25_9MICO|nr:hypothetical protein [Labedella gwakjiensis]PSL36754.1 hypothetical protein CLV49_0352 [Labedella gwakjiensis]RUQ84267.1 hypothetical protein ELQ93_15740 [Labedella gwakjiensis]
MNTSSAFVRTSAAAGIVAFAALTTAFTGGAAFAAGEDYVPDTGLSNETPTPAVLPADSPAVLPAEDPQADPADGLAVTGSDAALIAGLAGAFIVGGAAITIAGSAARRRASRTRG